MWALDNSLLCSICQNTQSESAWLGIFHDYRIWGWQLLFSSSLSLVSRASPAWRKEKRKWLLRRLPSTLLLPPPGRQKWGYREDILRVEVTSFLSAGVGFTVAGIWTIGPSLPRGIGITFGLLLKCSCCLIKGVDEYVHHHHYRRHSNGYHYHYTLHLLKTFRFEDENDYEYEIWLKVFSRILKI